MADFLEERIDHQTIRMGAAFTDQYAVNITTTSNGSEHRSLIHPYPLRTFDISQFLEKQEAYNYICALYHRAHGSYAGFRLRCYDEFSTNGSVGTPTAFDQPLQQITLGTTYRLQKVFGTDKAAGASGYPVRILYKPVSGTVKFGIGGREIRSADWSVDNTTGIITCAADNTYAITGVSKAAQAVISLGSYSIQIGESFHFSGVAGMTQINGLRGTVVAKGAGYITVDIDSTAFSTYTSGGVIHRRPQAGETVTGGCEFDFPVRFNGSLVIGQDYPNHRNADGIELVEILNP